MIDEKALHELKKLIRRDLKKALTIAKRIDAKTYVKGDGYKPKNK